MSRSRGGARRWQRGGDRAVSRLAGLAQPGLARTRPDSPGPASSAPVYAGGRRPATRMFGAWVPDRGDWRMVALGYHPELVRLAGETIARRWHLDPAAVRLLALGQEPRQSEATDARRLHSGLYPAGYGKPVARRLVFSYSARDER
jgi:hypothetical protein